MPTIKIPERVFPGFEEILLLKKEQLEGFAAYLKTVPISINFDKTFDDINEYLSSKLKIKNSRNIIQTIISFSELIKPSDHNIQKIANNLAESYNELALKKHTPSEIKLLKYSLLILLQNTERLRILFKAIDLAYENEKIFYNCDIIPDVRILFNDDLKKTSRHAIVLHKLHLNYRDFNGDTDTFVTMDLNDLISLKDKIDEAIHKDEIIRKDYQKSLNFI